MSDIFAFKSLDSNEKTTESGCCDSQDIPLPWLDRSTPTRTLGRDKQMDDSSDFLSDVISQQQQQQQQQHSIGICRTSHPVRSSSEHQSSPVICGLKAPYLSLGLGVVSGPRGSDDSPTVLSHSAQPRRSKHYDDEDYKNHRHLAYPHMHQSMLKTIEQRTVRRVRGRLLVARATVAKRLLNYDQQQQQHQHQSSTCSDDLGQPTNSSAASTLQSSTDNDNDLPPVSAEHLAPTSLTSLHTVCEGAHQLDPASPSLADKACSVGQALKSRQYEKAPWAILQQHHHPTSTDQVSLHEDASNLSSSSSSAFSCVSFCPFMRASSDQLTGDDNALESFRKKSFKPRRRRSRSKPFNVVFQPSLTKLSEEGSPMSSSTASSTVSIEACDSAGDLQPSAIVSGQSSTVSSNNNNAKVTGYR